jgi:tetratricopeptide (TPR) repeat protein
MQRSYHTLLITVLMAFVPVTFAADEASIVVDRKLMQGNGKADDSSGRSAAWLAYAATQIGAMDKRIKQHRRYVPPNDFAVELEARNVLAAYWRDSHAEGEQGADAYLDKLVEIADAGFMEEYVFVTFSQPGWTISAQDLAAIDLPEFAAWSEQHLATFKSQTLAHAEFSDRRITRELPGASLPDPQDFLPGEVACSEVASTLNKAATAWEKEAKSLPGSALTASDRPEMFALIDWLRRPSLEQNAAYTFVPARVGYLVYIAGFCAVDVEDYKTAERWLRAAVDLMPLQTMPRQELAQVLIATRRFDQADALVDDVLAIATDRCQIGAALRKRGFIRFEQGRLEEARSVYKKSLEYDPFSRLALSELDLLETEITRQGGEPDPYLPPPSQLQTTKLCDSSSWT